MVHRARSATSHHGSGVLATTGRFVTEATAWIRYAPSGVQDPDSGRSGKDMPARPVARAVILRLDGTTARVDTELKPHRRTCWPIWQYSIAAAAMPNRQATGSLAMPGLAAR